MLSIKELAKQIAQLTDVQLHIPTTNNGLNGNPQVVLPSIDRYLLEFQKVNFTPIHTGIYNTISWYKNLISYLNQ